MLPAIISQNERPLTSRLSSRPGPRGDRAFLSASGPAAAVNSAVFKRGTAPGGAALTLREKRRKLSFSGSPLRRARKMSSQSVNPSSGKHSESEPKSPQVASPVGVISDVSCIQKKNTNRKKKKNGVVCRGSVWFKSVRRLKVCAVSAEGFTASSRWAGVTSRRSQRDCGESGASQERVSPGTRGHVRLLLSE